MSCETINQENKRNIRIVGHNIRSWTSGKKYVSSLMKKSLDVLFVAEHRLYNNELSKLRDFNDDYEVIATSSKDLNMSDQSRVSGHCGVAIFGGEICHGS